MRSRQADSPFQRLHSVKQAIVRPSAQKWLKARSIQELPPSQAVVIGALAMKAQLGIVGDKCHPNGVDENDLLIIASAKEEGYELISNEARRAALPTLPAKYKIPAIRSMAVVKAPSGK